VAAASTTAQSTWSAKHIPSPSPARSWPWTPSSTAPAAPAATPKASGFADPNGKEAGLAFLAENKGAEGVITLPSGLQYKVLEEGAGLEHPTVSTPCECHYAGRLLDGTEFDSSYSRGTPTTFAPNQVIKGWTEAMQLMVVGDKWEMYIPMEMAYGPSGKPPKIPAAATLIFIMEIVKIKGETKPKAIVFPEWTAEQLELWLPKDQAAIDSWREARVKKYEASDAAMLDKYPTRELFDAWVDKQCKASKDKSLWKRTHTKKKAAPAAPAGPPPLTKDSARALLDKVLATFKEPANKESLLATLAECDQADAAQAGMMKMAKLMPAVQAMLTPVLDGRDLMSVGMEMQKFAAEDPSIAADVGKLMKAMQGDLGDLV